MCEVCCANRPKQEFKIPLVDEMYRGLRIVHNGSIRDAMPEFVVTAISKAGTQVENRLLSESLRSLKSLIDRWIKDHKARDFKWFPELGESVK